MICLLFLALFSDFSSVLSYPLYAQIVRRDVVVNSTYDFVIIGGGLSALTVANRLSEDPLGMPEIFRCLRKAGADK
jgi:choline dehydrogenase